MRWSDARSQQNVLVRTSEVLGADRINVVMSHTTCHLVGIAALVPIVVGFVPTTAETNIFYPETLHFRRQRL